MSMLSGTLGIPLMTPLEKLERLVRFAFGAPFGRAILPAFGPRTAAASGALEPLLTDLIAFWPMNEASGNRIDVHGGHTLVDALGVGSTTGRVYALAADFLNSQKFFSITNTDFNFGDEDFSICWWSFIDSYSTNYRHLFTHTGGEFTVKGPFNDSWATILQEPGGSIVHTEIDVRNAWAFHILQHDAAGNRHYVSTNDYYHSLAAYAGGITPDAGALIIGYHALGGHDADYILGPLFIYGRCLNGGEISWLYNNGLGRTYEDMKTYVAEDAILYDAFSWSDNASDLANHVIEPNNTPATSWTVAADDYRLQRGGAMGFSTPGVALCDPGKADAVIEFEATFTSTAGTTIDNMFRFSDGSNYWFHRINYVTQKHYIYEVNAGVSTLRASADQSFVVYTKYRLKATLSGSSIVCTINDANPLTYTSAFNATATKAGFRHGTGSLASKTDNYKVW